jgi:ssDNA-binding Zn-finger/Zn-ribbon topoisomerase 1
MKTNISPLCPHHNERMLPALITIKADFFESQLQAYACPLPECNERYSMSHGHFTGVTGESIKEATNVKRCHECGQHLYLAERGATTADTTWLCSNEECRSNKR